MPILSFDKYGKTGIRLTQVTRNNDRHNVTEVSVKILFEGDFARSYTAGDNTSVLPTDTIKNTVYIVARQKPIQSIEQFAADLTRHFLSRLPHLTKVTVELEQTPWTNMEAHDTAFVQAGRECRSVVLFATRSNETFVSGIRDLEILKTSKSAFKGYLKDEYTTLPETQDRLLGTVLHADWTYRAGSVDFNISYRAIRHMLLETFANHESLSVQHTLYAMGEAAMEAFPILEEIHLVMPNKHRLLVDLSGFGLDNPKQIFVPIDEPSGYIEARIGAGSLK